MTFIDITIPEELADSRPDVRMGDTVLGLRHTYDLVTQKVGKVGFILGPTGKQVQVVNDDGNHVYNTWAKVNEPVVKGDRFLLLKRASGSKKGVGDVLEVDRYVPQEGDLEPAVYFKYGSSFASGVALQWVKLPAVAPANPRFKVGDYVRVVAPSIVASPRLAGMLPSADEPYEIIDVQDIGEGLHANYLKHPGQIRIWRGDDELLPWDETIRVGDKVIVNEEYPHYWRRGLVRTTTALADHGVGPVFHTEDGLYYPIELTKWTPSREAELKAKLEAKAGIVGDYADATIKAEKPKSTKQQVKEKLKGAKEIFMDDITYRRHDGVWIAMDYDSGTDYTKKELLAVTVPSSFTVIK